MGLMNLDVHQTAERRCVLSSTTSIPARNGRPTMYKNLLVHIPTERSARPAVDGSISLAMSCGAHLDAIATGFERVNNVPFLAEGGAAVASIVELEYERATERAQAALAVFETEAKGAEISYNTHALAGTFGDIVATVAATARLYDLTVVSQGEPDGGGFDNQLPQELLLQTGRPLLMLPYTFRGAFKGGAHRHLLGRQPPCCSRAT
jgi:hypothetical protein